MVLYTSYTGDGKRHPWLYIVYSENCEHKEKYVVKQGSMLTGWCYSLIALKGNKGSYYVGVNGILPI